jgi:hypothetical protein
MELLERSLYCFEISWHHLFNPMAGNCRLEYKIEENRTFFLALFRYIQMLGREGTVRTALEYCKLLLGLDPTDPMFVLCIIDYFCIRSGEYEYLLKLFASKEIERDLSMLPNMCYNIALAKFHLENQASFQILPYSTDRFIKILLGHGKEREKMEGRGFNDK